MIHLATIPIVFSPATLGVANADLHRAIAPGGCVAGTSAGAILKHCVTVVAHLEAPRAEATGSLGNKQ